MYCVLYFCATAMQMQMQCIQRLAFKTLKEKKKKHFTGQIRWAMRQHDNIHHLVSDAYLVLGCGNTNLSKEAQTSLSSVTSYTSTKGIPKCSQASQRYNLSTVSWVCPKHLT